jgi:Transposase DDE domain
LIFAQRWLRVQYLADTLRNCKHEAVSLLADLPWHSLLLFDLGYFSFPFFDYLTERGYYWISRYREKTNYQLLHVYYRHHEILDALVWLRRASGALRQGDAVVPVLHQCPRSAPTARGGYRSAVCPTLGYRTGLLDHQRPLRPSAVVEQSAPSHLATDRRCPDPGTTGACVRLQIAAQAGCDPFDVSLPLLVEHLPQLLRARLDPLSGVLTSGKRLHLLRPSSRYHVVAPSIPPEQLLPLPADLKLTRRARYVT